MKTIQELLKERNSLMKKLEKIKSQIAEHNDGFIYQVVILSYGSEWHTKFTNLEAAKDYIDEEGYNGDNGYAHLYTNNPKVKNLNLPAGNTYFCKEIEKLRLMRTYPESKML